ncbi:hypothetical protein Pla22_24940 [Rubripirellula amarantea]|uniref:VTC domain protein n=1 Tax=Rubripirellula amarantea TaxID=2527999 RepID=A0A5C5WW80_9BACT|nr:hypothetical protein [Rubripirellula amarantea]TWT54840.1 hypothetical protein Pla22_24940 [Rubripirellula amarantea]
MKYCPRNEFTFAVDDDTTDALIQAIGRFGLDRNERQSVVDRYYDSEIPKRATSSFQQSRVRRINCAWSVDLQCKSWKKDTSTLRQTTIDTSELSHLRNATVDKSWAGKWFHKKLLKRHLIPQFDLGFDRAWMNCEGFDDGRLTLDRNIRVHPLTFHGGVHPEFVQIDTSILRMKFTGALPLMFKQLLYQFALLPVHPSILSDLANEKVADLSSLAITLPMSRGTTTEVVTCQHG